MLDKEKLSKIERNFDIERIYDSNSSYQFRGTARLELDPSKIMVIYKYLKTGDIWVTSIEDQPDFTEERQGVLDHSLNIYGHYQHYKGGHYLLVDVGRLKSNSSQIMAVYMNIETAEDWVRPIEEFREKFTAVGEY